MNRLLVIFIVVFAGVFGSCYLLMQRGGRPTAPGPVAAVNTARDGDAGARGAEARSSGPNSATDRAENRARGPRSALDTTTTNTEIREKQSDEPVQSPKAVEKSASKSNQARRVVVRRVPATPKPAETNAGTSDQDLSRLQGTWRIVDAEYDGDRMAGEAQLYTWEFQADKYTIKRRGNFEELWTVRLNSTRDPKTIDGTHDGTHKKLMGIYEVTDDTLKVCYDLTGNGRPDSFKAGKGSRRVCYYFKRP